MKTRIEKLTGKDLRDARDKKGWTQAEAAIHAGISREAISQWECRKTLLTLKAAPFIRLLVALDLISTPQVSLIENRSQAVSH